MPGKPVPRDIRTQQIPDIPLHLIPKTIADQIRGKHASFYRITARKMFRNRYTLTIETRKRTYRRFAQHKSLPPDPVDEDGFFMDMNTGR
jgi:hypothetical protein